MVFTNVLAPPLSCPKAIPNMIAPIAVMRGRLRNVVPTITGKAASPIHFMRSVFGFGMSSVLAGIKEYFAL